MGIDFEEFQQLWEVGVFSCLDIPCLKGHDNGFWVCVRPEMAMDSWFHKVEPMLGERAATDSPLLGLGLLKIV